MSPSKPDFHSSSVSVPLFCGRPDGWPRTSDGWLVRPGSTVNVFGATKQVVRKVYDGGEYGFCVEIEDHHGPQGWAPLNKCWKFTEPEESNGKF